MPGIYNQTGRHGPYNEAAPVWKAGIAVNPGDHCFRDTDGYDKPANLFPWTTDLATTLAAFKLVYRGVSMARRLATAPADGGRNDGMLLVSGEFDNVCAALGSAAAPGALVALAKQSGNALEPQKVAITATLAAAIGVLSADAASGQLFLVHQIKPATAADRGVQAIT